MESEFEAGDLVVMTFDFVDVTTRVRIREGSHVVLLEGPCCSDDRSGTYWLILSPGGIVINVPQTYFSYGDLIKICPTIGPRSDKNDYYLVVPVDKRSWKALFNGKIITFSNMSPSSSDLVISRPIDA